MIEKINICKKIYVKIRSVFFLMFNDIFIMLKYLFQKLFLIFGFTILMFFCSCTNTELINLNEGVKFIDIINNNKNYNYDKIKLSTSYTENNKKTLI